MKIIHINLSKSWRGGERQVFLLMQGIQDKGIEQVLICKKDSALERRCLENGLPYIAIRKSVSVSSYQILTDLQLKRFNIIHCHESKGHTLGILHKLFSGSDQKIILHRRVLFPIKTKPTTGIKYSEKNISKIICISAAVEKAVKKSIGFKDTIVIPSMVPVTPGLESSGILRNRYGIRAEKIIGYVAALTHEKDHYTFLDTAKLLIEEGISNIQFAIIGEGNLKTALIEYSSKLKLENYVTFTGFISEIDQVIPEIDVLLFTSVSEGLGSSILDFFVAKKPVVCVENGGSEEIVFDGKTGYICKKKDAKSLSEKVKLLLKDQKKVEELTENAFEFVRENFSVQRITEKTIDVYRNTK